MPGPNPPGDRRPRAVRWLFGCVLYALAAMHSAAGPDATGGDPAALVAAGRRIYLEGILSDGTPLEAVGAGQVPLRGADAACVLCHRRSGLGSREGSIAVPPVAGPWLFQHAEWQWPVRPGQPGPRIVPSRADARSAYNAETLARALREGVDPDGAALHPLMPHYRLGDSDQQALLLYLRQLSAIAPSGLQDGQLHLATVVTPDADPARAATVTGTLQAWAARSLVAGLPVALSVWRLHGAPGEWAAQLTAYQAAQPVFALLSGAGAAEWAPVQEFCEATPLPCLFPIVDDAPPTPPSPAFGHTLYFSRGVTLEAQLLAHWLVEAPPAARIVQWAADAAGAAGARELDAALRSQHLGTTVVDPVNDPAALAALGSDDLVVSWLPPQPLQALLAQGASLPTGVRVIQSEQRCGPEQVQVPPGWSPRLLWISAHNEPALRYGKGVLGLQPWLQRIGVAASPGPAQFEVYAATYYLNDALARMRGRWNQEYLLETLINSDFTRPAAGAFVSLSLANGQTEAAHAGVLLGLEEDERGQLTIVPRGTRITP